MKTIVWLLTLGSSSSSSCGRKSSAVAACGKSRSELFLATFPHPESIVTIRYGVLQHLLVIHLPGDVPHLGKGTSDRDQAISDQLSIVKHGLVCVSSQFDALPNCDPRPCVWKHGCGKASRSVSFSVPPPLWQPVWAEAYDQPLSVDSRLWWMELSCVIATPWSNAVTSQFRHNIGSVGI